MHVALAAKGRGDIPADEAFKEKGGKIAPEPFTFAPSSGQGFDQPSKGARLANQYIAMQTSKKACIHTPHTVVFV